MQKTFSPAGPISSARRGGELKSKMVSCALLCSTVVHTLSILLSTKYSISVGGLSYNADQAQRMDSNEPSAGQHTGSEHLFS